MSSISLKIWSIKRWNNWPVLRSPTGNLQNCQAPQAVTTHVFLFDSSSMGIWWYAFTRSSLENRITPLIFPAKKFKSGSGYPSRRVFELSSLKSPQFLNVLSSLGTWWSGEVHTFESFGLTFLIIPNHSSSFQSFYPGLLWVIQVGLVSLWNGTHCCCQSQSCGILHV